MLWDLPEGTVLLNKAVRTIWWRGSFYEEGDDTRAFPVRVECEDGDAFLADHVIVTVPLGEDTNTLPCLACPLQPVGVVVDWADGGQRLAQTLSQPPLFLPGEPQWERGGWEGVWGGEKYLGPSLGAQRRAA